MTLVTVIKTQSKEEFIVKQVRYPEQLNIFEERSLPVTFWDYLTPAPIFTLHEVEQWFIDTLTELSDERGLKTFELKRVEIGSRIEIGVIPIIIYIKLSQSEGHLVDYLKYAFLKKVNEELLGRIHSSFSEIKVELRCELTEPVSMVYCELKTVGKIKEENIMKQLPEIKKIIHSGDYTHIMWADGTKTSVKKAEDMPYDAYSAFAQAVVKKLFGSTEKAKFEHELRQHSEKEQKKILADKESRRAKQQKAEKKKIDRELKRQEKELAEKEEQVKATRAKRQSMFKRSGESM